MKSEVIKGYKAFETNMTCRGFQFEVDKEYEEKEAKLCEKGFHFCERPLDVLRYYEPCDINGNLREFCTVEGSGKIDKGDNQEDSNVAVSKIKIGAKIGIAGLVKAEIEFEKERIKHLKEKLKAVNSGYSSSAVNSGYRSSAVNSGYSSSAVNSGHSSSAVVNGENSIAVAWGIDSMAKGKKGCYLTLSEWEYDYIQNKYILINAKTRKIDGKHIKEDTFYKLKNGKFVEVEEQ